MKIRRCGACAKPSDMTCTAKLWDISGEVVNVVYCKPCIDKVAKKFEELIKKPEVEETEGAWSTATYDSD